MNKYQNGKIYKLVSPTTDKVYIGSTIQTLKERFRQHKRKENKSNSKKLGQTIAIVLIETYPCNCKKQLELRERYWIDNTQNTINKCLPGRTLKEYYRDNLQTLKPKYKEYRKTNKEEINRKRRKNKDKPNRPRPKTEEEKIQYDIQTREIKITNKILVYHFIKTWGGDPRSHNNLLNISIDIFN